jgi:nucleotide-binding universal stress UspA family protein
MSMPAESFTILVPLDGSRLAESVLPAAEAFASRLHASFSLVHVIEKNVPATIHGERHLAAVPEAEAYLESVATHLRDVGGQVSCHVHEEQQENVAQSIVEHADEIQASLILMCSHGRGGLRNLLFGSIAQQTLKRGQRSILLIHPQQTDGAAEVFAPDHILVPLDGTAAHEPALPMAVRLARAFDAELRLLLVIPTLGTLAADRAPAGRSLPTTMRAVLDLAEEEGRKYLDEVSARCRAAGTRVDGELVRGDPVPEIVTAAARSHAELVVLASHGRRGLDALFRGSVAPRVAGRVGRPLLLVQAATTKAPD